MDTGTSVDLENAGTQTVADIKSGKKVKITTEKAKKKKKSKNKRRDKILMHRNSLPIFQLKGDLIKAVTENRVVIVSAETGSGKSTQMAQYLFESGFAETGIIGCTQPRRKAVTSLAQRVTQEMGCTLGKEVGYSIRFDHRTCSETKIKYMTEGILLREFMTNKKLNKYSIIILDEAHERTIHMDVLLGLIKHILKNNSNLKVIVSSATLDCDNFSKFFWDAPVISIPGRMHDVKVIYLNEDIDISDYSTSGEEIVMRICLEEPEGDILFFLTGQEEIETACENLRAKLQNLNIAAEILPAYSALPDELQKLIFKQTVPGRRKIVVSTNIAETSLTIDGIRYVVDPGFVKQNYYDPQFGINALQVIPISRAQAKQRMGRAGRTGPGMCYRLYKQKTYDEDMFDSHPPAIMKSSLSSAVLLLKSMNIDIHEFNFMDDPLKCLKEAQNELIYLEALDHNLQITALGRKMVRFPLEPMMAKMLIKSFEFGCSEDILTIVAMLTVSKDLFYWPAEDWYRAASKKRLYDRPEGDHLTLLYLYNMWMHKNGKDRSKWCEENFLQKRALEKANNVRQQLHNVLDRVVSGEKPPKRRKASLQKYLCFCMYRNSAHWDPVLGCYKTLIFDLPVHIHPRSALFIDRKSTGPECNGLRNILSIHPVQ